MTISFEVIPECGLKNESIEFILGTPINQMISALQNVPRIVKNIQFIYCPKDPFSKDMCINLKDDGIRLIFDNKQQVLKIIEVYSPSKLTLYFGQEVFSKPDQPADIQKVQGCFGATHPGEYDDLQKLFLLNWRGISFAFPAKDSSAVQSTYAHGLGSLHFSNSSIPVLERMTIFYGSSLSEIKIPSQPVYTLCGTNKLNKVDIIQEDGKVKGLKINFSCEWSNDGGYRKSENVTKSYEKIVMFGSAENQVISDLGSPSRIFYKSDEKMLIQKGVFKETKNDEEKADYFFNYFTMGLVS
uniref:UPF0183 protein C16orf70 (inferred by orthology to a human protein) n=1 Tax=Strongyloides venezuelensis TaxID=75913 RepID=A0A0K0F6N2_STRVS